MLPVGLGSPSLPGPHRDPLHTSGATRTLPEGAYAAERAAWMTRALLGVRLLPGQESNLRRLS